MAFYYSYSISGINEVIEQNLSEIDRKKIYVKDKFHCTMLYSKQSYNQDFENINFENIEVKITDVDVWNTNNGYVLVAKLDNENLLLKHNKIKEKFNLINDKFSPHITLQKEIKREDILDVEKFRYLIGKKVMLINFSCIEVNSLKHKLKL